MKGGLRGEVDVGDPVGVGETEAPAGEPVRGPRYPPAGARLEPDSILERTPLESLAAAGELRAFRHEGFWDCMDTYKDAVLLNDLWERGDAPWKVWA